MVETARRRVQQQLTILAGGIQSPPRKFFVGGNFKSNGTLESIKAIVENLNKAELKSDVGEFPFVPGCGLQIKLYDSC